MKVDFHGIIVEELGFFERLFTPSVSFDVVMDIIKRAEHVYETNKSLTDRYNALSTKCTDLEAENVKLREENEKLRGVNESLNEQLEMRKQSEVEMIDKYNELEKKYNKLEKDYKNAIEDANVKYHKVKSEAIKEVEECRKELAKTKDSLKRVKAEKREGEKANAEKLKEANRRLADCETKLLLLKDNSKNKNTKRVLEENKKLRSKIDELEKFVSELQEKLNGTPRFTCREIKEIRLLLNSNVPATDVAKKFKVSATTIRRIKRGETYKECLGEAL